MSIDRRPAQDYDKDVPEAVRLALWAMLHPSVYNPFIALDVACELVLLDPLDPNDRATFVRMLELYLAPDIAAWRDAIEP
jgi:hypothetical protein